MVDIEKLRADLLELCKKPASQIALDMLDIFDMLQKSEAARKEAQAQLEIKKEEVAKTKGAVKALAALQAEFNIVAKDAARYRWVREQSDFIPMVIDGSGILCVTVEDAEGAIDFAMQENAKNNECESNAS